MRQMRAFAAFCPPTKAAGVGFAWHIAAGNLEQPSRALAEVTTYDQTSVLPFRHLFDRVEV